MVNITWNKNIEPEVKAEIEKHLLPWLWLVPVWCGELTVSMWSSDNGGNANIRTSIKYEYRIAHMDFYSCWLIDSDYNKGISVVHDLLHIPTSVYVDYAEDAIQRLCTKDEAPRYHDSLMEESRIRCESMTQDLAKAIYDKFNAFSQ